MRICEIATTHVEMVSEDASLSEAAALLKKSHVGTVVIVKDKDNDLTPIGIITDRDVAVRAFVNEIGPNQVYAKDLVVNDLLVIKQDSDVSDAIKTLSAQGLRRAPVVDVQGKLAGIVSFDDLLLMIVDELHCLAEIIKKQVGVSKKSI